MDIRDANWQQLDDVLRGIEDWDASRPAEHISPYRPASSDIGEGEVEMRDISDDIFA
jgi:hypothetical protein